ncbi:ABC transporter substrate-binding protein [Actinomyces oricola]
MTAARRISRLSRRELLVGSGALTMATALAACSNADPFAQDGGGGAVGGTVVVGSQQYYSNEIIAEIYAQVIEGVGLKAERQFQIGQREVYLPELEAGRIDVIPEYSGNLLRYYDASATAVDAAAIQAALLDALPASLAVLDQAPATDQDTYVVTRALAEEHGLTSIGDLTRLGGTVRIAANSELATRPYGPQGLMATYGVDAKVTPVEDSGGPLTVKALTDGDVEVADIYSSNLAIENNDLVALQDPKGLIQPQNLTPLVAVTLNVRAVQALDAVSAVLTPEALRAMNARSTDEQADSATIAADWLATAGLV